VWAITREQSKLTNVFRVCQLNSYHWSNFNLVFHNSNTLVHLKQRSLRFRFVLTPSWVMLVRSAFFWDITQRSVLVVYRRFGPLMLGPIGCPATSVQNYHSTLRNILEERRSHLHRGGRLTSRTEQCFVTFLHSSAVVSCLSRIIWYEIYLQSVSYLIVYLTKDVSS
jgi:hypothetical protein